ncbi:dipeptidyl aminopeptidase/acylaminoacyl peptidase [Pseudonocardia sediminis]|uniref:Dipeptidyl aminopeptidase/acylaminoacyl peptidase n=1 Tax=Pseudonocardia sediminis TaxID=1397368 RepID=A0A4Q7UC49_PSEST|nr:prolyl oligopeptidase family serine peptidase [Pseudonocardia sediminis]RZT75485.1 dipeptidyl aminopeptidase/acylaminoacyl peptidase [Pseudonocardia sediminis]
MSSAAGATETEAGLTFTAPARLFADDIAESRWRGRVAGLHTRLPSSAGGNPARSVYSSNRSGTYELWVWDRESDEHRQATDRASGTQLGALSADGEHLWWFNDTDGNEFGHWVRQPFAATGSAAPVAPEAGDGMASGIALGAGVAVFGLATREGVAVWRQYDGQPAETIYQHAQDAMVGPIAADATRVIVRHTEHGDASTPGMRAVDVATGASTAELRDEGLRLVPLGFAPISGDPRLLAVHERRGRDQLLLWDTDSGAANELDIDLPGQLEARWFPDGRSLLLLHSYAARTTMYRYALDGGTLEQIGPDTGCVEEAGVRPDGTVEYSWSSASSAPRIQRWDAGTDTALLGDASTLPADSVPVDAVWIDGPGGPIHTLISRPDGLGAGPHRTVFRLHGGPFVDDRDVYSPRQATWVDAGWTVVTLNYRGSTGYGAAWRQSIVGRPGLTEIEDLAAVQDWCVQQGVSDTQACVMEGYSWGGYLVLLALAQQPERWRAGIAGLPITDHAMAYEDAPEPLRAMARALFGGAPDEVPERYTGASPLAMADRVEAAPLIIAGRNDPRCPIRQINAYAQRLSDLGKPPAMYRYDGGHGTQVSGTVEEFLLVAISFAEAALTQPPSEAPPQSGELPS